MQPSTHYTSQMTSLQWVGTTSLGIYLGLGPVYWLPMLSMEAFTAQKYLVLMIAIITLTLARSSVPTTHSMQRGILGLTGFLLATLGTVYHLFDDVGDWVTGVLLEHIPVFLMIWLGYVASRSEDDILHVLRTALYCAAACAGLASLAVIFGTDMISPSTLRGLPVSQAGFGGGRSGWSNGLAMLSVIAVSMALHKPNSRSGSSRRVWHWWLVFGILLSSQLMVLGRAGIIGTLIGSMLVVGLYGSARVRAVALLTVIFGAAIYGDKIFELLGSRFAIAQLELDDLDSIDKFSSGRISNYFTAWAAIAEKPWFGHGFRDWTESGVWERYFVHNLWLRLWYQGGFVYAALIATLVVTALANTILALKIFGAQASYLLSLVTALVISMFEPNFPFGTFQNSAIFWFLVGVTCAYREVAQERT